MRFFTIFCGPSEESEGVKFFTIFCGPSEESEGVRFFTILGVSRSVKTSYNRRYVHLSVLPFECLRADTIGRIFREM